MNHAYMDGIKAVYSTGCTDSDGAAIISAMTTPPSARFVRVICATVRKLKTFGLWSKLDCLYMMAVQDAQAATINWKSPGTRDLTILNSWPHEAKKGFGPGNGTNQYATTNYAPGTHGSAFTLDDAFIAMYSLTNSNIARADMGARNASSTNVTHIYNRNGSGLYQIRINQNAGADASSIATSYGWRSTQRFDSLETMAAAEGVVFRLARLTSTEMPTQNIFIGAENSGGSAINISTRQYAAAAIGGGMSYRDHRILALIMRWFLAEQGVTLGSPISGTDNYRSYPRRSYTPAIFDSTDEPTMQGVAYDGIDYYVSNATHIRRLSYDAPTNVYTITETVAISQPSGATQINHMDYYDGYLWVGCSNFPNTPKESWLLKIDPYDLSVASTYELDEEYWSEGGAWKDVGDGPEFWNVFTDWDRISRYKFVSGVWTKVNDYLLPLIEDDYSANDAYQGAAWIGNILITTTHSARSTTEIHYHRWTGTGFDALNKQTSPNSRAGQGLHLFDDSTLLLAVRGTSPSAFYIYRCEFVPYPEITI
jgi:hypothetical protein